MKRDIFKASGTPLGPSLIPLSSFLPQAKATPIQRLGLILPIFSSLVLVQIILFSPQITLLLSYGAKEAK